MIIDWLRGLSQGFMNDKTDRHIRQCYEPCSCERVRVIPMWGSHRWSIVSLCTGSLYSSLQGQWNFTEKHCGWTEKSFYQNPANQHDRPEMKKKNKNRRAIGEEMNISDRLFNNTAASMPGFVVLMSSVNVGVKGKICCSQHKQVWRLGSSAFLHEVLLKLSYLWEAQQHHSKREFHIQPGYKVQINLRV